MYTLQKIKEEVMDRLLAQGFKYLSIEEKEFFRAYYDKMNDNWASSVSFASMIAWNQSIKIYYKVIGDYICCLAQDTAYHRWVILPFIGFYCKETMEKCMAELIDIMEELGLPIIFTDISEWMLPYYNNLEIIRFEVSFHEGLSDYVYQAKDFEASWNRQSTRYDYNYFVRKNNPQLVIMEHIHIQEYKDFITETWCNNHNCDYCQYGCSMDADINLIEVLTEAEAKGITVYVDQKMIGYCIVTLERDQLFFHFKKSVHRVRGIGEYMHRQCYELFGAGANIVNYTEDLNIEGLRKYKQKLAKYELSHKYELNRVL